MKKAHCELLFSFCVVFKVQLSFQSSSGEYSSVCFTGGLMKGLYVEPSALLNNLHCTCTCLCECVREGVCVGGVFSGSGELCVDRLLVPVLGAVA